MTEAEVRKLRKKALTEMYLNQLEENERLTQEIAELKKRLEDKEILLNDAGTIAEASFEMNQVLAAAEAAAKQYLDNVKALTERKEAECILKEKAVAARCIAQEQATYERCTYMKAEAEKACSELETATKTRCEEMEILTNRRCEDKMKETEEKCLALTRKAEQDVEEKWDDLSARLEEFYRAHIGLKSLLTVDASIQR